MQYDLELERAVKHIKSSKAKTVCIQLPDALKKQATYISSYLEKHTKSKIFIWLSTCYGSCDYPNLDVDLLIQWGHSKYN